MILTRNHKTINHECIAARNGNRYCILCVFSFYDVYCMGYCAHTTDHRTVCYWHNLSWVSTSLELLQTLCSVFLSTVSWVMRSRWQAWVGLRTSRPNFRRRSKARWRADVSRRQSRSEEGGTGTNRPPLTQHTSPTFPHSCLTNGRGLYCFAVDLNTSSATVGRGILVAHHNVGRGLAAISRLSCLCEQYCTH